MAQYLNLLFDVVHVLGARRSAIYDLRRRRIFSLDKDATDLVKSLFDGQPIEETARNNPDITEIISYLQKNSLAQIDEFPRNNNGHLIEQSIEHGFQTAWIELGTSCNHKCLHCYNYSAPTPFSSLRLDTEPIKIAIQDLHQLGTKSIKFIGGEPLAFTQETKDLAPRRPLGDWVPAALAALYDVPSGSAPRRVTAMAFRSRRH